MDLFESLREDAAQLHAVLVQNGANPLVPEEIVAAAVKHLGLTLQWVSTDDPTLNGARALLDEQLGLLCCAEEADTGTRVLIVAHEIGHARVHGRSTQCRTDDIDPSRSTEAAPVGLERVEDYGAHERRELQANVYGRELVLPRSLARALHVDQCLGARAVAHRLSLPIDLVRQQILDALLLPVIAEEPEANGNYVPQPDPSQDVAASHRGSAFLLQAGPGAGKTRTLVKHLEGLLAENVDPASVLVLTFSNRAAGELAERISAIAPERASKIWIGTFHAFGLDLLRRYHSKFDLPADPMLFDRSDAIEVLEEILPTLPLQHYRNLWDPAMVLKDIVTAISRAKDELIGPARYRELAESMQATATTEEEHKAAEKASEVAYVYELYEQALRQRRAVDFGDLIMRPALLLEADESVRTTLRLRHRYVLVDEYQDVNHASARLLRAVAGDGRRLWVVGDARQSIYRFRGASSDNLRRFMSDYPDARTAALEINHRSSQEILDLVEGFAEGMDASKGMLPLKMRAAHGKIGRRPQIRRYGQPENEISGVAANIRELEAAGVTLRAQAVLCRTNARLNEIAEGLEARGIPVLHLGSLFERPEVRDCLALLSLMIDPFAAGLVRVSTFPRYRMSLADVQLTCRECKQHKGPTVQKLAQIAEDPRLSRDGAAALSRLITDLEGFTLGTTAWEFLATWLMDHTRTLVEQSGDDSIRGRMRGVALWQFLNFVRVPGPPIQAPPIRRALDRVRQLVLLAEERDLRQVPASALRMNAVRLMTIHGSKGLEFKAVHVPGLVTTSIPASPRPQRCPPPTGLIQAPEAAESDALKRIHAREEECLFFVAASRAQRELSLTLYAKQANGDNRGASAFLPRISRFADDTAGKEIALPSGARPPTRVDVQWPADWVPTDDDIRSYYACPRRFFYTGVLRLGTARKPTAFSLTNDCLYAVIEWLSESRLTSDPTLDATLTQFEQVWTARGPCDHAYASEYHRLATGLVKALVTLGAGRRFQAAQALALDLPRGRVLVHPDEIAKLPDGAIVVRRIHTGRKRSDEYDRIEYTLYTLAGRAHFGEGCRFEAVHLADELADPIEVTARKLETRKAWADESLAGARSGNFPANPDSVTCPRCPHFFICDAAPPGPLIPLP